MRIGLLLGGGRKVGIASELGILPRSMQCGAKRSPSRDVGLAVAWIVVN
jgi:hypothetical protein